MKISTAKFRANCFKIIDEISQKQTEVIITKRGKAIVKLIAIKSENQSAPMLGVLDGAGETVGDLIEPFNEEWKLD